MRHIDGQMASMSYDEYFTMITNSPIDTRLLEFRHRDSNDLVGCMLIDRQRDGLSAVYSFFDPEEEKRSFGSFMILYLIELTKMQRMSYLYLGYYINFSQKMSYKINFKPYEIFEKGTWQ
jgi:arginyl-tRNA--protein-N-Asp/Glu arginylyltransferase